MMLTAIVGFLAIPGMVISYLKILNNNKTEASQVASSAPIASYMSIEASVGSIVTVLLLVRHNSPKQKDDLVGPVWNSIT